jgi:hypothetical protein
MNEITNHHQIVGEENHTGKTKAPNPTMEHQKIKASTKCPTSLMTPWDVVRMQHAHTNLSLTTTPAYS